ncbi:MAG TPA: cupin domain-containing protein, partial [Xanthobacteraceae bacterium]|nr:cupin domain-containing protein [Xanthobacteraceae bacterium]
NASRTILSDKGGYTVVEGERCTAARGDLILTPNGTWHDHGNDDSEPVFKTLNYSAQLLRPGEQTELKRETAGTYYVVIEGTGATEVGGKRFEWAHNDLFVVPNFLWRRHINTGKTDAVIYSVSDAALMKNIGQYYAQGRSKDGKVTELVH